MNTRVGQFFLIVSLLILFIFAASYQVDDPRYNMLLLGLGLFILGAYLIFKHRARGGDAQRFRWIRKMLSRRKKD